MNRYLINRIKQMAVNFKTKGQYWKMRTDLPYCLQFVDNANKELIVLNRHYQPLGIVPGVIESTVGNRFHGFEASMISVDEVQLLATNTKPGGNNGIYYFYDDATSPGRGGKSLSKYKDRVLKAFNIIPLDHNDFIQYIRDNLQPDETITPEEEAEYSQYAKEHDWLLNQVHLNKKWRAELPEFLR